MVKAESKPIPEKELQEESEIEEEVQKEEKSFRDKDGTGYGDLMTTNVMPYNVNTDSETYVGKPAPSNDETYIQESKTKNMVDLNKLTHTRIGDHINYYQNGIQDSGVVAKMAGTYITIFKEDGTFHDVHVNDTFFVSDILVNKTWNDMNMEERTEELMKVKAYSPRYLSKTWEQLPKELQSVLKVSQFQRQSTDARIGNRDHMRGTTNEDKIKLREAASTETAIEPPMNRNDPYKIDPTKPAPTRKRGGRKSDYRTIKRSDQEQGAYGNIGGRPNVGISTDTKIDADDDYEGNSHDDIQIENQFQHDVKAPKTDKDPVKKAGEFVYTDNPKVYKVPEQTQKGYGMKYGVKYISEEDSE